MSMGGSSPPTPPSPEQVLGTSEKGATAQQGLNVNAQAGSQYNQGNWLGGLQYNQTGTGPGGVPIYSATTSLSSPQQGLYSNFLGAQQEAGGQAANALGFGNYGSVSPDQQIGDMTSGRTGQMMNTWLGSQIPFFNTQTDQLNTRLVNEGFKPGDPSYDIAMRQLQTNQGLGVGAAASQFEPAAFSQAKDIYGLPMNVGQQLAQWGAPISPTGQFTNQTPALQPGSISNLAGPMTTAAQNQYAAQQGQYTADQNAVAGLFGMGGNALASLAFLA